MSQTGATNPAASSVSLATAQEDQATSPASSTTALIPQGARAGSTATLTAKPPAAPAKDYEQAFAALSSSYGFSGGVLTKNPIPAKAKKKKTKKSGDKGKQAVASPATPSSSGQQQGSTLRK
ncbi:hypothetical protein C8Q77DRAFT_1160813 [Trametes polyzona]|nr:hypothetical protein C8Q77DRAFT_1160813 [Trametes polyzona]